MFDTHCHLNVKRFNKSRKEVITQAFNASVTHMMLPGIDLKSSLSALEIASNYPTIYAAVGIHPEKVSAQDYEYQLVQTDALLQTRIHEIHAIGETGLDALYQDDAPMDKQITNLIEHIHFAKKHQKPLILHSRGTTVELLKILREQWDDSLRGNIVFHCCESDERLLTFAIENKVFIGVDGDITYDQAKQSFIENVPLDLLVLETDSPYLLPEPLKTKKAYPNIPANIAYVAKSVAETTSLPLEKIVTITTENALKLFSIHT